MENQNPVLFLVSRSFIATFICDGSAVQPGSLFHYSYIAGKGGSEFDTGKESYSKCEIRGIKLIE